MEEKKEVSVVIPYKKLSNTALLGVISQFVSRDGIDSSHVDISFEEKVLQVKENLEKGRAFIVFDHKTESCNIVSKNDPEFQKTSGNL